MTRRDDQPRQKLRACDGFAVHVCDDLYVVHQHMDDGRRIGICVVPRSADEGTDALRRSVAQRIAQLLNLNGLIDVDVLVS